MPDLFYRYLGRVPYGPTWDLQRKLVQALVEDHPHSQETLLALEHEPVITIGRRGKREDLLLSAEHLKARGIEVHEVDRGGEVTYHGPGQLVLYPIVRVRPSRFGVGDLVRGLAGSISGTLQALAITTRYDPDNPGLWIDNAKICAVGMRVARGISSHGAAVNVTTDLDAFRLIVPCGMPGAKVTSVARQLNDPSSAPGLDDLAQEIARRFAATFGFSLR